MKQDPLELDVQVPIILKIQNKAGLTGSYPAAILSTATLVPLLAAFLSVASYVIQVQPPWFALLSGSLIVALGWLLTAFYYRRNTAVDLADPSSYNFLLNNLREQERWFRIWESQPHTPESIINDTNIYEIQANFKTIASDLSVRNGSWAAGTGYINISRLMHRIGEAFLDIVPNESLIAEAFRAEAELTDSTIPNKDHLLTSLRIAVKMFGEQDVYLNQQPSPHQKDPPQQENQFETAIYARTQARSRIREISFALNQFRDDQWENLINARNHLTKMTVMTGCVLYLIVSFAILTGTRSSIIIAATFYFLTGVIIGLFSRLYEQSKLDTIIDDIRLTNSRLMAAPLFSGLAAIGGVLITQKIVVLGANYTFDTLNAYNFLVAAAFGLTPGLLISAIQKKTDQYKVNLKSTEGTTEKKPSGQRMRGSSSNPARL